MFFGCLLTSCLSLTTTISEYVPRWFCLFLPPAHPIEADNLNLNIMLIRLEESGIVMLIIIGTVPEPLCLVSRHSVMSLGSPSWDTDATHGIQCHRSGWSLIRQLGQMQTSPWQCEMEHEKNLFCYCNVWGRVSDGDIYWMFYKGFWKEY